jgi:putative tryptophan/tyrosine transport system substrate-binding protein
MQLIERFAKELVALQPDLILSSSTPTTASLLQQTRTIPVIFANIVDPVGSGFVASLARPAGNVTGFLNLEPAMAGKWVQLLKEIAPRVARVAIPFNPDTAPYAEIYLSRFKAAAASFGMEGQPHRPAIWPDSTLSLPHRRANRISDSFLCRMVS